MKITYIKSRLPNTRSCPCMPHFASSKQYLCHMLFVVLLSIVLLMQKVSSHIDHELFIRHHMLKDAVSSSSVFITETKSMVFLAVGIKLNKAHSLL